MILHRIKIDLFSKQSSVIDVHLVSGAAEEGVSEHSGGAVCLSECVRLRIITVK